MAIMLSYVGMGLLLTTNQQYDTSIISTHSAGGGVSLHVRYVHRGQMRTASVNG